MGGRTRTATRLMNDDGVRSLIVARKRRAGRMLGRVARNRGPSQQTMVRTARGGEADRGDQWDGGRWW